MPDKQREALWLKYGEGLAIREIGRVMGKTQVHIRVLLYRARVKLAERLTND